MRCDPFDLQGLIHLHLSILKSTAQRNAKNSRAAARNVLLQPRVPRSNTISLSCRRLLPPDYQHYSCVGPSSRDCS